MLARALLAVIAATERTEHPPPGELIALTCNEIRHLFTSLITEPPIGSPIYWPGHVGDGAISTVPTPATTADKKLSSHDHGLRLEY